MAGGGALSPRQKMINMMYLVLMAMLALNVSIEVIEAFISVGQSIEDGIEQLEEKNKMLYSDLEQKNSNNPNKYGTLYQESLNLKAAADKLVRSIQNYKNHLIIESGSVDPKEGDIKIGDIPKQMAKALESTSIVSEFLFAPGKGKSQEFEGEYKAFRDVVLKICEDSKLEDLKNRVQTVFNTNDVVKGDVKISWIKDKFEHYPLAAGLAFFAQIQSQVRSMEADILRARGGKITGDHIQVNTVEAIIMPLSTTVVKGTTFKAKVMLAAYDNTLEPEVFLYNSGDTPSGGEKKVPVKEGKGEVEIPTSSMGLKKWGGYINLKDDQGRIKKYEFKGDYDVTEPVAVMSPTKLNVVYRGVVNPMEISVPGISPSSISVQGPGIRNLGGGKYEIEVTNYRGNEVNYTIVAEMGDGSKKSFPPKLFRIKEIPNPVGTVRGESEPKMPISNLAISTIGADLPGFEFELKLIVTGFSVKVEGQPTIEVKGNKFDDRARRALNTAKIGSDVFIRDIKVSLQGNSSYRVKTPSPISVTVTGK